MTKDIRDRNALAAEWLQMRIRQVVTETEREFGVYAYSHNPVRFDDKGDYVLVETCVHIWPEAMRIIETERDSLAIG